MAGTIKENFSQMLRSVAALGLDGSECREVKA